MASSAEQRLGVAVKRLTTFPFPPEAQVRSLESVILRALHEGAPLEGLCRPSGHRQSHYYRVVDLLGQGSDRLIPSIAFFEALRHAGADLTALPLSTLHQQVKAHRWATAQWLVERGVPLGNTRLNVHGKPSVQFPDWVMATLAHLITAPLTSEVRHLWHTLQAHPEWAQTVQWAHQDAAQGHLRDHWWSGYAGLSRQPHTTSDSRAFWERELLALGLPPDTPTVNGPAFFYDTDPSHFFALGVTPHAFDQNGLSALDIVAWDPQDAHPERTLVVLAHAGLALDTPNAHGRHPWEHPDWTPDELALVRQRIETAQAMLAAEGLAKTLEQGPTLSATPTPKRRMRL